MRVGAYLSAAPDVTPATDPFGDGRIATGFEVMTARTFPAALVPQAGERYALEYILTVSTSTLTGTAIADFSRTLNAIASTSTEGATLAMIHAVPIPEPEQVILMLCGLLILFARNRVVQRRA